MSVAFIKLAYKSMKIFQVAQQLIPSKVVHFMVTCQAELLCSETYLPGHVIDNSSIYYLNNSSPHEMTMKGLVLLIICNTFRCQC